jgi:iron complex outermembrane receptor protein
LFWIPGGNENLKPESGYFAEFGSRIVNQNFSFSGSVYVINISDWIQWMPNSGIIWSPMNLKSVIASGVEMDVSYTYKLRNTMIKFTGKGQWNRIFSTTSIVRGDDSKYKQLIYIPMFTGWATISLDSKAYRLGSEFSVFSKRYIAADHSDFLPEYMLANLYLGIRYSVFGITVRCQNIFDTQYYSMANRPMPRLNYFLELSYGKIH